MTIREFEISWLVALGDNELLCIAGLGLGIVFALCIILAQSIIRIQRKDLTSSKELRESIISNHKQNTTTPNEVRKMYANESREKKISRNLEALYESKQFFDLILMGSDGRQIRAHRIILCLLNPSFEDILNNMPNTKQPLFEVKEFKSATLESVLKFIYTGSVDICLETVRQVLKAAAHFEITPLMDVCFDFMRKKLNCSNCIDISLFAEEHDWHLMPEKRLNRIKPRTSYQNDKLFLVTGYFLSNLSIYTYYRQSNTWTREYMESSWDDLQCISVIVEKCVVIIVGGVKENEKRTNEIKFYNMETKEKGLLPSMRVPRSGAELVVLNEYLYVIGGRGFVKGNLKNLKSVERYDLSEKKWEDVNPLIIPIQQSRAVGLNGCLFIVDLYNTQCYNVNENLWTLKAPKTEKCEYFGLASVGGYLFTVGGCHMNGELSGSVERYNPLSDTWDVITSLRSPLYFSKCLSSNNSFIVVGGLFSTGYTDSVEEYNIETNEWKTLAPLPLVSLPLT